jgi:hypothetical protein
VPLDIQYAGSCTDRARPRNDTFHYHDVYLITNLCDVITVAGAARSVETLRMINSSWIKDDAEDLVFCTGLNVVELRIFTDPSERSTKILSAVFHTEDNGFSLSLI